MNLSAVAIDETAAKAVGKLSTSNLMLSSKVCDMLVGERTEARLPVSGKMIRMTHGNKRLPDGTWLFKLDSAAVREVIEEVKKVRPDLFAEVDSGDGEKTPGYYSGNLYLHTRSDGADWLTNTEARALIIGLSEKL